MSIWLVNSLDRLGNQWPSHRPRLLITLPGFSSLTPPHRPIIPPDRKPDRCNAFSPFAFESSSSPPSPVAFAVSATACSMVFRSPNKETRVFALRRTPLGPSQNRRVSNIHDLPREIALPRPLRTLGLKASCACFRAAAQLLGALFASHSYFQEPFRFCLLW